MIKIGDVLEVKVADEGGPYYGRRKYFASLKNGKKVRVSDGTILHFEKGIPVKFYDPITLAGVWGSVPSNFCKVMVRTNEKGQLCLLLPSGVCSHEFFVGRANGEPKKMKEYFWREEEMIQLFSLGKCKARVIGLPV